jgi:hypothetical protein
VKRRHVARDPTTQLATWIAAEFTKRRYEEWDLGFLVFAAEMESEWRRGHTDTADGRVRGGGERRMWARFWRGGCGVGMLWYDSNWSHRVWLDQNTQEWGRGRLACEYTQSGYDGWRMCVLESKCAGG